MVSYGYDAAHRLTSESRSGANSYSKSYTLDGVGNRTAQTVGGTSTSFTYSNDDELTATSGGFANSYSYNANGEQTGRTLSGTAYSLSFDYDGQVTQIAQGGSSVSYAYDALGRRYSRTAGGTTITFQSAGSKVLLEKQGTTTTATYTYGNALIRKDGEVPLFDGLGSERTVTDSTQAATGTLTTEGFGQTVATTGSSTNPYMFAATSGYRNDGDAGLMHVGARYYDAQVGRFITRDTYLDQKPYLYCEHDPVNAVDPTGHQRTLQWYVNVVQAIVLQNWDMLVTLIVIVGGDEIPPEIIAVLTPTHPLPAMNTNPTAVSEVRGLVKQLVSHIGKAAQEGAGNPSYRHHLREIRTFWATIVKKLKR